MEKLHEFAREGRSVLIHTPQTPRAWMNHLWNEEGYLSSVSQVGAGESRYVTAKNELNQIIEGETKHVYLRDDDSGVCWSPTYGPLNEPLDSFVCEHNLSFTEIRARKDGISSALRYFVPMEGLFELWHLVLRNESESTRRLSAFALTGWELTGFPHARYYYNRVFTTSYHVEKLNGIFAHSDNPYAPHERYKAFLSCSEELSGHEGFLPAFLGGAGSPARPAALLEGRDCTGSQTACYGKGAVLQNKLVLQPGETKELTYCLGVCASEDEAAESLQRAFADGYLEGALAETEAYWEKIIARCSVKTPEEDFDAVMNVWLKKQMMYCRVEKKGVRDNMQIADGVVQIFPECGRAEVLEVLAHQFQDGHTVLTWYPYDDTYYSDQPMWLVMGVAGYIRETGDYDILQEVVPYQDGGEGTVWEHLKAGLELKQTDLGPNGLCRIRYADWNDSLNILTDDNAESVFVTAGLGYILKEMAELADRIGEKEFAAECRKNHAIVADKMNRIAWDGEYYARALHKDGVVGGHESEGSKIFSNPQSWAIIADLVPDDRLPSVLKAMDERCEHDFGLLVNAPVYDKYTRTLGRISAFPPGLYENGVYCHATGFAIVANAMVGRGETALRLLRKIMPDSQWNPSSESGAEPYVVTSHYLTNPRRYGWSCLSWITGASVWCFKGLVEWIVGVRRGYDGLVIDPCLPPDWPEVHVQRTFRGATYSISIRNPEGLSKGRPLITVDGEEMDSNILPVFGDGKTHDVVVTMKGPKGG